jgi:hypothetical protein
VWSTSQTFEVRPSTGTVSHVVPIERPPRPAGVSPDLALA